MKDRLSQETDLRGGLTRVIELAAVGNRRAWWFRFRNWPIVGTPTFKTVSFDTETRVTECSDLSDDINATAQEERRLHIQGGEEGFFWLCQAVGSRHDKSKIRVHSYQSLFTMLPRFGYFPFYQADVCFLEQKATGAQPLN